MNNKARGLKAKATQIAKYGSLEAYRAEMKRRRSLATNHGKGGFAYMKRHGLMDKLKEASKKGQEAQKRKQNASKEVQGSESQE